MALKGEREVLATSIYFVVAGGKDVPRGTIMIGTATDGECDQPTLVHDGLTRVGTERPVGLLLDDVENLDYTTRPEILVRNVKPRGSEVSLLVKGRIKTNLLPAITPLPGQKAFLAASGWISNAEHVVASGIPVGHFESGKDADGYARVWIDIQGQAQKR